MTSKNKLIYLPLGGAGEIGMNMYLYGYGSKGKERFKIYGVLLDGTTPADEGAELLQNGVKVGDVTFGMYSNVNNHNVGIARMPVAAASPGTALTVRNNDGTEIACTAQEMPFYDKDKSIREAKG